MLLTIYDKAGNKRADVAVNDSSTQSKEVQGDNVLSLSFSYYDFLPLDVNDYTDYLGERYWLTERYTPKQVNEGEWDYDLKLRPGQHRQHGFFQVLLPLIIQQRRLPLLIVEDAKLLNPSSL